MYRVIEAPQITATGEAPGLVLNAEDLGRGTDDVTVWVWFSGTGTLDIIMRPKGDLPWQVAQASVSNSGGALQHFSFKRNWQWSVDVAALGGGDVIRWGLA